MKKLSTDSQVYMRAKKIYQYTEFGRDRFVLATDMRNLMPENFTRRKDKEGTERNKLSIDDLPDLSIN